MNQFSYLLVSAALIGLTTTTFAQRPAPQGQRSPQVQRFPQAQRPRLAPLGRPVNAPNARGVSKTWSKEPLPKLVENLRRGGYVFLFRHGATDWRLNDQLPQRSFNDRSTQRPLSELGRADARAIGSAFKTLAIPVGKVYSSPYFRARDFADLAFGRHEMTYDLMGINPANVEACRQLLATVPPAGANTILSGHQLAPIKMGIFATNELEEGSCGIFKPQGNGKFELIAHLSITDWQAMTRDLKAADARIARERR